MKQEYKNGLLFDRPTTEVIESTADGYHAKFSIKPLYNGFGTTLGNSLRRVLLSALPGAAIVNVKIGGVSHEFQIIPGVYEDVVGIILNLKKVVFRTDNLDIDYSEKLSLFVENTDSDELEVRAADFQVVTGVEIVNPEIHLASLSRGASISLEVEIRRGYGYASFEVNKRFVEEVGVISIDSIFAPIDTVTFQVEKNRSNDDILLIDITTNHSVKAEEALAIASNLLIDYYTAIKDVTYVQYPGPYIENTEEEVEVEEIDPRNDVTLAELDLGVRVFNALKRAGYNTVGDLLAAPELEITKIRSLGKKSLRELKETLAKHGYYWNNKYFDGFDSIAGEDFDDYISPEEEEFKDDLESELDKGEDE
ncbi:MAG: DNA-directed RNA polymerase subunit alpha [Acholeplasmatales bacterium]|jgi:DNA-directed RNA polymerase subunit alpha|nr:DNA-directed RNA polymerase subunit alpha [Acholeplasmatales bacterium]